MKKIENILRFAMRMEKDAGDFYSFYIDKIQSPATKELFKELSETEKQHYNVLEIKFKELGFKDPPITISWVVDKSSAAKDPHILANDADLVGTSDADMSDLAVIRMAYLIESDFALFYKNAAEAVEDKYVKNFLNGLAEWETQHKDMFYKRYQNILKKHWSDISSIIFAG